MSSNPSIERISSGLRPPSAAHVKRWADRGRLASCCRTGLTLQQVTMVSAFVSEYAFARRVNGAHEVFNDR